MKVSLKTTNHLPFKLELYNGETANFSRARNNLAASKVCYKPGSARG